MATAIRPASYAPLDLKRLVAVGHPHKQQVAIRRESAFVPPRVLFALAYVGYVITGVVCCWAPPLAAEEAAGVAIPSDATCLRATRHADYSTVEVGIGTPVVQMSLLLRLDILLEAGSAVPAMRLFSQEVLESSTVSCTASGECEDVILRSHGVNSGFGVAVGRFSYAHPGAEYSEANLYFSGVVGELQLREGNAYWLTATHLCWKESESPSVTALGGIEAVPDDERRLRTSVEDLAKYGETALTPVAFYARYCGSVSNTSAVELFPALAGAESKWLSITNGDMYNSEPGSVDARRLVVEVGTECAANVSAMQSALVLYQLDCNPFPGVCRAKSSLPFRRIADSTAFLDTGPKHARIWVETTETLRQLPKLASTAEAFLFGIGKLALITLCAAIVYVRSRRPTASSSWLFKHCMQTATANGQKRTDADSSMTPIEDMAIGAVAVLARFAIVRGRFSTLVADGQTRVLVTETIGSVLSLVHWTLRYVVLENRSGDGPGGLGELPISKLGGSTAIIDSTAAVMLSFSQSPILVLSLGKFDPTARLLIGILMSIIVVSRAAFSACCCGILLDAEYPNRDPDRALYLRILAWSGCAWVGQSLCLSVLMADVLVTPAAYSMSRGLVGEQLPSRLLLFTALVCSGLPRLMKTFRNIIDDKDHSD